MARKDKRPQPPKPQALPGTPWTEAGQPVRPFADVLAGMRRELKQQAKAPPPPPPPPPEPPPQPQLSDEELLAQALAGVRPLEPGPRRVTPAPAVQAPRPMPGRPLPEAPPPRHADVEIDTADWWAGDVEPALLWAVDAGGRRWQRRVDLHALDPEVAQRTLRAQIRDARRQRLRCLLVVHGQTRAELPAQVREWLQGELAPGILGYSVADPEDGGLGALYVWVRPQF